MTSEASDLQPRFPLYIPSKGRSEYMMTSTVLTEMGVPHYIVVEPQEVEAYQRAVAQRGLLTTVLTLDMSYKDRYELCDWHGLSKSTGPGPARNFAWDHSVKLGAAWHWVMDDNISKFCRLHQNRKVRINSPAFFRAQEDFVLRYSNVAMAGPNYFMFAPRKQAMLPFVTNTRIYSCNLIRNDVPRRWRGRYNEDTILSLDVLKDGWCTIQFNSFLQYKLPTQTMGGGNTQEFYHREGTLKRGGRYADNGTLAKSRMQVKVHPDVSKVVWKFSRWHHHVDYSRFKAQKLIRRKDIETSKAPNNYGMELMPVEMSKSKPRL